MFKRKIETYSIREFLAGNHHTNKAKPLHPTTPLYGFMGLDINSHSVLSSSSYNAPYTVIFCVAGVVILSTLIEHTLMAHGHERAAESIQSLTSFLMPVCFYIFLAVGMFKILL